MKVTIDFMNGEDDINVNGVYLPQDERINMLNSEFVKESLQKGLLYLYRSELNKIANEILFKGLPLEYKIGKVEKINTTSLTVDIGELLGVSIDELHNYRIGIIYLANITVKGKTISGKDIKIANNCKFVAFTLIKYVPNPYKDEEVDHESYYQIG